MLPKQKFFKRLSSLFLLPNSDYAPKDYTKHLIRSFNGIRTFLQIVRGSNEYAIVIESLEALGKRMTGYILGPRREFKLSEQRQRAIDAIQQEIRAKRLSMYARGRAYQVANAVIQGTDDSSSKISNVMGGTEDAASTPTVAAGTAPTLAQTPSTAGTTQQITAAQAQQMHATPMNTDEDTTSNDVDSTASDNSSSSPSVE